MVNTEDLTKYEIVVQGKRLKVTAIDTVSLSKHPNTEGKDCNGPKGTVMIYSGYISPVVVCDTCYNTVK